MKMAGRMAKDTGKRIREGRNKIYFMFCKKAIDKDSFLRYNKLVPNQRDATLHI